MLIIFFDPKDVVHEEFVPEGKPANAEFYKGVMDRLLKRIQRVRSAAFCSRDFFLLHDNAPAYKAASACQFLPPKKLQSFITSRTLQLYLRQTIFCSPSWKWGRTPLCGCWWNPSSRKWRIKEGPKRRIFGSFSETVRPRKSVHMPMELNLNYS